MKALTLWQPYASSIALEALRPGHGKIVENRTWPPPASIIGERIAIHAGAKKPDPAWGLPPGAAEFLGDLDALPRSAIVCTARVVGALDCRKGFAARRIVGGDLWDRQARTKVETLFSSRWWVGPVGWLLDDVRACARPVPCKGAMGLWTVPAPIAFDVGQQTAEAA
jgi:hypothetical protein